MGVRIDYLNEDNTVRCSMCVYGWQGLWMLVHPNDDVEVLYSTDYFKEDIRTIANINKYEIDDFIDNFQANKYRKGA